MPYFLLPKMDGDLVPFGKHEAAAAGAAGYEAGGTAAPTRPSTEWGLSHK